MKSILPKTRNGFTLVELLVVMAILGILGIITLTNFSLSQKKGRDMQRKADLRQISTALEAYYTDHGAYPLSGTVVADAGKIMSCTCGASVACNWGGTSDREFCDENNTVYMKEIPDDTISPQHYCYWSDSKSYKLYANFENRNDVDCLSKDARGVCQELALHACNGINYIYGVSSTNTIP